MYGVVTAAEKRVSEEREGDWGERERSGDGERGTNASYLARSLRRIRVSEARNMKGESEPHNIAWSLRRRRGSVCVCVCVGERESASERERELPMPVTYSFPST